MKILGNVRAVTAAAPELVESAQDSINRLDELMDRAQKLLLAVTIGLIVGVATVILSRVMEAVNREAGR